MKSGINIDEFIRLSVGCDPIERDYVVHGLMHDYPLGLPPGGGVRYHHNAFGLNLNVGRRLALGSQSISFLKEKRVGFSVLFRNLRPVSTGRTR